MQEWVQRNMRTIATILLIVVVTAAGSFIAVFRTQFPTAAMGFALGAVAISLATHAINEHSIATQTATIAKAIAAFSSDISTVTSGLKAGLCNHNEFYERLTDHTQHAKRCIKVISVTDMFEPSQKHHAGHLGKVIQSSRAHYFDSLPDILRDAKHITFKRIVVIKTRAKLAWVKHVRDDEMADCSTYEMKYLDTDSMSMIKTVPPVFAVQVVDDDRLLLADIIVGDIKASSTNLWVEGSTVVQFFDRYYDKLWDLAREIDDDLLDKLERELPNDNLQRTGNLNGGSARAIAASV